VVRCKSHVKFRVRASRPVAKSTGLHCDQTIQLSGHSSSRSYPEPLRRIRVYHPENKVSLVLLTNQFEGSALGITDLYRQRWQVELFFKWIKQPLRLRAFYGRSENAVRCQIWSALCAYLLVAIVKKKLKIQKTLNEMLQMVSVNIFAQTPLPELLAITPGVAEGEKGDRHSQKLLRLKD
jgi:IS4 transposase